MKQVYDADATEVMDIASDFIDELVAEGMTQGDILNVFTTAVVTWAGEFERTGNQGALRRAVRTQPQAIKEVSRLLGNLADSYEERRKRRPAKR
ncbi:hypothetical protein [Neoroseomonas lacus]|uniref:Uncharacterized protein n=1 Tax=Neoroseomonas lacus TaxID=287609 RepID=A0A917L1S2_9PROT|nr:hypothetical protein [Neoroseomonas lacus]GGJ40845.1 hypothetical protein GCM10011320_55620 [Neoroseomonas lacus]